MSSIFRVFSVDWDDFISQSLSLAGPELDIYNITDNGDGPEPDYTSAASDFLECSEQFKEQWPPARQEQFDQVFHKFFWYEVNAPVARDLSDEVLDAFEGIAIRTALNPVHVNHLAVIAREFDFEATAATFKPWNRTFYSFKEYRDYGQFWLDALCEASKRGCGLVIVDFC